MMKYVLGFAFDHHEDDIASGDVSPCVGLIMKNRPEWQAGKVNGIGGKIEPGEDSIDAMRREFWEETGVAVDDWHVFATIDGPGYVMYVFRAFQVPIREMRSMTDEKVAVYSACNLPGHVIPNLRWLVPLALDQGTYPLHVNTK